MHRKKQEPAFTVTLEELKKGTVSLEELRQVFIREGINSTKSFHECRNSGIMDIPSFYHIEALCVKYKGMSLCNFFGFPGRSQRTKKLQMLTDPTFVRRLRKWCKENNIVSYRDYLFFKGRPEEFPSYPAIVKQYGLDFFTDVLGLKRFKTV
jgi:hypothetical protein